MCVCVSPSLGACVTIEQLCLCEGYITVCICVCGTVVVSVDVFNLLISPPLFVCVCICQSVKSASELSQFKYQHVFLRVVP